LIYDKNQLNCIEKASVNYLRMLMETIRKKREFHLNYIVIEAIKSYSGIGTQQHARFFFLRIEKEN
jgi:hypothetical protein